MAAEETRSTPLPDSIKDVLYGIGWLVYVVALAAFIGWTS